MSVKVMGRVWEAALPPNLKLVLLAFADAAEHDGSSIYPGEDRLTAHTGYSRSQIYRITNELKELGVLVQVRQGKPGQRAEYLIEMGALEGMCPDMRHESDENVSHQSDNVSHTRDPSRPTLPSSSSPNGDTSQLFEAFYEFWTAELYKPGVQLTDMARGRINKAVKEARKSGITAEEVRERGGKYRQRWSSMERTPQALLANWPTFAPEVPVEECGECENRGVVWFDSEGERVDWDALDADSAVLCPSCHSEVPA